MIRIDHQLQSAQLEAYTPAEQVLILYALEVATAAHAGQRRKSGRAYITHCVAVAAYCIELGLDADTVAAALLHDTVEDTATTLVDLEAEFGPEVAGLVDGVTKLGEVKYTTGEGVSRQRHATSVENMRKLLLAISRDLRVIMIKLADRRHNVQTLHYLSKDDRQRIARETLDIYAPLADRLGMGVLKAELEDMAFACADPVAYGSVTKLVANSIAETQQSVELLKAGMIKALAKQGITPTSIHGRNKHFYSVYRKLAKAEGDISKIYDLVALRIVVADISQCYQVLGVIHQQYKPLIYRIKDYIAVPKPNGYRSLHTTVLTPEGHIIEIQIRTAAMHTEAEQGLAAHVLYEGHKDTKEYRQGKAAAATKKLAWVGELAGLAARSEAAPELMEHLKIDLFRDRIFVFSPLGDLYDLPEGATPLDFAFAVHSNVGLRAQGARVNGKLVALSRPLENRDVVEIITRRLPAPNHQWLNVVKTATARSRIKAWFREANREATIATGRELLEAQLGLWGLERIEQLDPKRLAAVQNNLEYKSTNALLAGIGEGSIGLTTVLRRLFPSPPTSRVKASPRNPTGRIQVIGAPELPCKPAPCCKPEPPDLLVGYITRGSGVTVHRADCPNIPKESGRLLSCQWETTLPFGSGLLVELKIECHNRLGLVRDITAVIATQKINIVKITTYDTAPSAEHSVIEVEVELADAFVLSGLIQRLTELADVISVRSRLLTPAQPAASAHSEQH